MKISHLASTLSLAVAAAAMAGPAAYADDISGAGSTFYYPIAAKWADSYKKETGIGLNYQSIGSGGGIKQIKAGTVTFGASDKPLTVEQLDEKGFIQFPAVMGAVVAVVNLPGIKAGELTLDGTTLSQIFLGSITQWNDARIAKLNPGVKLPSTAIAVVHRSDGSGTTFLWTDFLAKADKDWRDKVGSNSAVEWPVGIGAKGNEGVAGVSKQTVGSIAYVEYAYAKQNKLTFTKLINSAGKTVSPTLESFQAAAANAEWTKAPGFYLVLTDQPGDASWPVVGAPFVIVYKKPSDPAALLTALKFFDWSYKHGQKSAEALDYVPMPEKVVKVIEAEWTANIKDAAGQPLWK